MSSCDPRPTMARRLGATRAQAIAIAFAALLAGCASGEGFQPMYGPTGSGVGLQDKMSAIDIATIPSRVGQRIRNELVFQSTGGGVAAKPEFKLEITIKESLGSTLVKSSGEALSQIYNLDANFKLTRMSDKKVLLQGASHARAGFERFQQIYSNVRAREDAENRAAKTIADDLRTRLAAAISRGST